MRLAAGEMPAIATAFVLAFAALLLLPNVIPSMLDSRHLGIGSARIRFDKEQALDPRQPGGAGPAASDMEALR